MEALSQISQRYGEGERRAEVLKSVPRMLIAYNAAESNPVVQ